MKEKISDLQGCVAAVLLIALPCSIALDGVVLALMWRWFVAQPFGLPPIRVAHAAGLCVMTTLLTYQWNKDSPKPHEAISHSIAWPLFALGLAWIVHLFM